METSPECSVDPILPVIKALSQAVQEHVENLARQHLSREPDYVVDPQLVDLLHRLARRIQNPNVQTLDLELELGEFAEGLDSPRHELPNVATPDLNLEPFVFEDGRLPSEGLGDVPQDQPRVGVRLHCAYDFVCRDVIELLARHLGVELESRSCRRWFDFLGSAAGAADPAVCNGMKGQ